jgi:hypothetical protein
MKYTWMPSSPITSSQANYQKSTVLVKIVISRNGTEVCRRALSECPVGEEEKGQTGRRAFRKGPRNHLQVSVADVCDVSVTRRCLQGTNDVTL